MRGMLLLILMGVVGMPHGAAAVFYNNTEVIEIGDGVPPPPAEPGDEQEIQNEQGDSGGGGSQSGPNGGSTTTGGGSTGPGEGGGSGNGSGTAEELEDIEEQLINLLTSIGALIGAGGGSGGGAGGSGGGTGGEGGFTVRIVGDKVRAAFEGNLDLRDILRYWQRDERTAVASTEGYGLVAASTALRDSNVDEVLFTAERFEITYKSRSYLLAVIPWSLPVHVSVIPAAKDVNERIQIKLPWYRFFVRTFFTTDRLRQDIDEALTAKAEENPDADSAALFETVADVLRRKVGTLADSVLLGTEPQ